MKAPVRIFISYAHDDREYMLALKAQLAVLIADGTVEVFEDGDLRIGESWDETIRSHLLKADFIVVLLSPSFIASKYITRVEYAEALRRWRGGGVVLWPVLVRWIDLEALQIAAVEARPKSAAGRLRPLAEWRGNSRDKVLAELAAEVRTQVVELARERAENPPWLDVLSIEGLREPTGIALDGNHLYVADHALGTLMRIDGASVAESVDGFDRPHHLAAMSGQILLTDTYHNRVVCFNSTLKELWSVSEAKGVPLKRPHGAAANTPGIFYVLDSNNGRCLRIDDGPVESFGRPGRVGESQPGEFAIPCGVALGPKEIFIADTFNHRVQIFDQAARYLGAFGDFGYGEGEFAYPVGVANWRNWLAVSDELNGRLQLWALQTSDGARTAVHVLSHACGAWLKSPFGLAFSTDGRLYVADRKGSKVLVVRFQEMLGALGLGEEAPV